MPVLEVVGRAAEGVGGVSDVKRAGFRLKQLRDARKLVQRDIEKLTEGLLNAQQVSRIERGDIEKPAMQDLVALGALYDLTPNDLAQLYGYWRPSGSLEDPALRRFAEAMDRLPPKFQERLRTWLDVARTMVETEARAEGVGE